MRHRVSNVEAFRQWEADPDADEADLLAKLRGKFEPSPAMLAGTAFHKLLELAPSEVITERAEVNGHVFTFAGDFTVALSPIRELRASRTYTVDNELVTITGQVDEIEGKRIVDHKTTGRFDPERYLAGYQWRLYLEIFGADVFRWNVFELRPVDGTEYEVTALHRLEQCRYPGLGADCQSLVERFARYVRDRL
jgi:hypothetical protein